MKAQLAKIDKLIATFQTLSLDYPESPSYRKVLEGLCVERAELTSRIGRAN